MKLSPIRYLALSICLLLTPCMAIAGPGKPEKVEPPKPLSEFTLTDHLGASFTQKQLTG